MCRIAGLINKTLPIEELNHKVHLMCKILAHGGPDDEGFFVDEQVHLVFGHRRLSIIDLSANGHQPMAYANRKLWITFNGEIYNYPDIRSELVKQGVTFQSNTDTEVILAAYAKWGTHSFSKLRGMFAFALYDYATQQTFLVRDMMGIKPLYYYAYNGTLSFASEVRVFTASGIATEKDQNWPVRFLAYGHIPEPYTTLKNVLSLPKGHFLCWNHASSTYTISSYQSAVVKNKITNINEAREKINYTLTRAVQRQLIADAPIGVFLSGGIDSSLITLLANEQHKHTLKTVSIFFNEKSHNEQTYQRIINQRINGENFAHLVRQQDFETAFPDIINAMDMPTTDGINSWFISKYAHENGLKAVLSGIGADELFGGYPSFSRIKYLKHLRKIHPSLFSAIGKFLPDKYQKINFLASKHPLSGHLLMRGIFSPLEIARLLNIDTYQVQHILFEEVVPLPENLAGGELASWFELNLYMQNQLLRDTDVMSMNHGLEVRVPFLDEDLVQLADSVDPEIRFDQHQPKKLLIDSFTELLPTAIWNRPKMGFSFPLQRWMMDFDEINSVTNYNGEFTRHILKKFKNNKVHWSKTFMLYQIQKHV